MFAKLSFYVFCLSTFLSILSFICAWVLYRGSTNDVMIDLVVHKTSALFALGHSIMFALFSRWSWRTLQERL